MQSTLLDQFQQQVRFSTFGNPGCNQRFLFILHSMWVEPGLNPAIPRLKFSTRVGVFWLFFCSHQPIDPDSTRDVGQTSSSVNTTLVTSKEFGTGNWVSVLTPVLIIWGGGHFDDHLWR